MDERIDKLASELYNKGIAVSMWEARMKAKDILGISGDVIRRHTEAATTPDKKIVRESAVVNEEEAQDAVSEILREAGTLSSDDLAKEESSTVNQEAEESFAPVESLFEESQKEEQIQEAQNEPAKEESSTLNQEAEKSFAPIESSPIQTEIPSPELISKHQEAKIQSVPESSQNNTSSSFPSKKRIPQEDDLTYSDYDGDGVDES